MKMTLRSWFLAFASCIPLLIVGCASTRASHDPVKVKNAPQPALSTSVPQAGMVVAVSPVRQTLQIAGSFGTVLGAGISAVQDGQYGAEVRDALGDYDPGTLFEAHIIAALQRQFDAPLNQVPPQGTTAGFNNARDARNARIQGLRRGAYDYVLDLELRYGIYGPQGILALTIDGELIDLRSGRRQWRNDLSWYSVDLLADQRFRDPTQRLTPNITAPRFSVEGDAVAQWTSANAEPLKQAFEEAVAALSAALLADLGFEETPEGLHTLGVQSLLNRDYEHAQAYFDRALKHEQDTPKEAGSPDSQIEFWTTAAPTMPDTANGLTLALAAQNQVDHAIHIAQAIVAAEPDYMPARYNLAWWHAVEMNDPDSAREHYDWVVQAGATPSRRLERAMN